MDITSRTTTRLRALKPSDATWEDDRMHTFEDLFGEYLRHSAVSKEIIDGFLDHGERTWAQFDPELGYVLGTSLPRDGVDGSRTISTSVRGMRTPHNYVNKPCRINTYGNSFTQCHQVSDGETWQEYLSAHLGEPVRNFGMGGFGVYQAYRRMLRTESSSEQAENIIFYIWGDDHHRSVMRCRYAAIYTWFGLNSSSMFHGNFWSNLEMDMTTGRFAEKDNICPTPQSLYSMCDPHFMREALKDDLMLQLQFCASEYLNVETVLKAKSLQRLAEILQVRLKADSAKELKTVIHLLTDQYAFASTRYILEKISMFAQQQKKKLLIVIFDPYGATRQLIREEKRCDQEIVDYLESNSYNYFDMNRIHYEDYKCFRLTPDDYYKRYFITHYNPCGNHFFAFSIKDRIIEMLEPKPLTYRKDNEAVIDFDRYLNYTSRAL